MITGVSSAISHIRNIANSQSVKADGRDFGSVLSEMISGTTETMKMAEKSVISGITGQASVTDVVYNVLAAERTLQTALSIRDKAVNAFQEISRLQI